MGPAALALLLAAAPLRAADAPKPAAPAPVNGGMLDLSCVSALAAVGRADLAGVFSFIAEKDAPTAFADFLARNKTAMGKYLAKAGKDLKDAGGITPWDHQVVMRVLELYASPAGETVEKPPKSVTDKLSALSLAPTMALNEITPRRKK